MCTRKMSTWFFNAESFDMFEFFKGLRFWALKGIVGTKLYKMPKQWIKYTSNLKKILRPLLFQRNFFQCNNKCYFTIGFAIDEFEKTQLLLLISEREKKKLENTLRWSTSVCFLLSPLGRFLACCFCQLIRYKKIC